MNRFSSFFGREHFSLPVDDLTALYNLFLAESFSFSDFRLGEERADFWVLSIDSRRLQKKAAEAGIRLTRVERKGIPALFFAYRYRWGLLLGGIAAALLLFFSSRFVWDLRIVGNERIPTERIEAILSENGLSVGTPIKTIHAGELENKILLSTDEISWISINLHGTVARVQVMESVLAPSEKPLNPANLVAASDGQIELVELYRGKSVVKIGQAVRAGELLISGISDNRNGGFFYTRAAGRVLARTQKEFRVEVPFVSLEERTEKAELSELTLNFFSFRAKIYKRTGKTGDGYAIIETKKGFESWGLSRLPVSLSILRSGRTQTIEVVRSEREVLELAYAELSKLLEEASGSSELLKKEILTEWTKDGVVLICSVSCIENIAEQVEFEILP